MCMCCSGSQHRVQTVLLQTIVLLVALGVNHQGPQPIMTFSSATCIQRSGCLWQIHSMLGACLLTTVTMAEQLAVWSPFVTVTVTVFSPTSSALASTARACPLTVNDNVASEGETDATRLSAIPCVQQEGILWHL